MSRQDPATSSQQLPALAGTQALALSRMNTFGVDENDDDVIDLRQYWQVIWKHRLTIIIFTMVVLLAVTIHTALQTPQYRSTLTLQIERNVNRTLSDSMMYAELYSTDFYQTQYELIKSYTMAERVARDLNLTSFSQLMPAKQTSFFQDIFGTSEMKNGTPENSEGSAARQIFEPEYFASTLQGALNVRPVKNSRLAHISIDSQSPQFAADAVNSYAKMFMEMNLERRVADASYAQSFLTEQIKQARANLEDSEVRLVEYARDKNIADLDDRLGGYMTQLKAFSRKLSAVEAGRIAAQAAFEEVSSGEGIGGLSLVMDNRLIQARKESLGKLESEYAEKLKLYKPAYPAMKQLQAQIQNVKNKIVEETSNIHQSLKLKYRSANREEKLLKTRMAQLNSEILDLRKRTTDYQTIKRDVESSLVLYDNLLQQTKAVGVAAGIRANNISVVDAGRVSLAPFKPNLQKNLTVALMMGLMGGIGLAFLFDKLDDTVKSSAHLEELTGLAVLGIVPAVDKKSLQDCSVALLTKHDPKSAIAEAYRSFRTALSLSSAGGHPPILHISSSGIGEGKTTTALGAATTLLQTGAKVLLIDADLRSPSIHKELSLPNDLGLTSYIAGDYKLDDVIRVSEVIDGLSVVTAGPIPPNPAELLASERMSEFLARAEEQFDVVIIDGPPVLGLADSLVLSSMSSATVLVVDSEATKKTVLADTLKRLNGVQANVIGTILTKYRNTHSSYRYMYSYYGMQEKSQEKSQEKLAS